MLMRFRNTSPGVRVEHDIRGRAHVILPGACADIETHETRVARVRALMAKPNYRDLVVEDAEKKAPEKDEARPSDPGALTQIETAAALLEDIERLGMKLEFSTLKARARKVLADRMPTRVNIKKRDVVALLRARAEEEAEHVV